MKYTKAQLIEAHHKWNLHYVAHPEDYEPLPKNPTRKYAADQVDHLLSFLQPK